MARELAALGAPVTGPSVSPALLRRAWALGGGMHHVCADIAHPPPLGRDLSVSHFSLTDMEDLPAALAGIRRIPSSGSRFVAILPHPCFRPPNAEGRTRERAWIWLRIDACAREGFWRATPGDGAARHIGAHHRQLSTYLNALADSGFRLRRLVEPPHPRTLVLLWEAVAT